MVIDAKNKLKPEHISQFLENASDVIIVAQLKDDVTSVISEITKRQLVDCFLTISFVTEEDIFVFSSEDTQLFVTGMDINWWKQNARRYNKLYKAAEEVFNAIPPETYRAAIGMLANNEVLQIKVIEGTKKQITDELNEELRKRILFEDLHQTVVINLAYNADSPNNLEEWLTLEELENIGAVKLS